MSFTLKALYERAEDYFMADQVSVFLEFCKREFGKEPRDEVSEQVFQGYVDSFERGIKWFNKLFKENWYGFDSIASFLKLL